VMLTETVETHHLGELRPHKPPADTSFFIHSARAYKKSISSQSWLRAFWSRRSFIPHWKEGNGYGYSYKQMGNSRTWLHASLLLKPTFSLLLCFFKTIVRFFKPSKNVIKILL
jgi:hypothetical protein